MHKQTVVCQCACLSNITVLNLAKHLFFSPLQCFSLCSFHELQVWLKMSGVIHGHGGRAALTGASLQGSCSGISLCCMNLLLCSAALVPGGNRISTAWAQLTNTHFNFNPHCSPQRLNTHNHNHHPTQTQTNKTYNQHQPNNLTHFYSKGKS